MVRLVTFASAVIALITLLSGGVQLVTPGFVLQTLQADVTPTSAHFFRIIGAFMMLFGGLVLDVWLRKKSPRTATPIHWCAGQKAVAVLAVSWGVFAGLFAPFALAVAGFDLLSAVILYLYARSLA